MDENDADTNVSHSLSEGNNAKSARGEDVVLVYTTFPMLSDAQKVGRNLIEARLAACVNIFPGMISVYTWDGQVEEGSEAAMLIKTARARVEAVLDAVQEQHPFDTPARLVLPVAGGGEDFLSWIVSESTPNELG